jgi:signal transduction histidine kinase
MFTTNDGLMGNQVNAICEDETGAIWFGTNAGVSRFDPSSPFLGETPHPRPHSHGGEREAGVRFVNFTVRTDRAYTDLSSLPDISAGTEVTIAYSAIDFKTHPRLRQYRVKMSKSANAHKSKWSEPTRDMTYQWTPQKPGTYIFEVQAIDRDLRYSDSVCVQLTVVQPSYEEMLRQTREELEATYRQLAEQNVALQRANEAAEKARQEAERAREDVEVANRAKSVFLANMSHEIRTPLNAVLGYAQILQRAGDLQPRHRSALNTIYESGEHLRALIEEVLDLSRIEAGQFESQETDFDLSSMIHGLSTMFALRCEEKELNWRVEWKEGRREGMESGNLLTFQPSNLPSRILVHGDENKLRGGLINLLGNAVKFTQEGLITLRIVRESDVSRMALAEAGHPESTAQLHHVSRFTLHVIDTGPGIEAEHLSTIFEPFSRS